MTPTVQPTTIREFILANITKRLDTLRQIKAPDEIIQNESDRLESTKISDDELMDAKLNLDKLRISPSVVTYGGIENGAVVGEELTVADTDKGTLVIIKGKIMPVSQLQAKDLEFWP